MGVKPELHQRRREPVRDRGRRRARLLGEHQRRDDQAGQPRRHKGQPELRRRRRPPLRGGGRRGAPLLGQQPQRHDRRANMTARGWTRVSSAAPTSPAGLRSTRGTLYKQRPQRPDRPRQPRWLAGGPSLHRRREPPVRRGGRRSAPLLGQRGRRDDRPRRPRREEARNRASSAAPWAPAGGGRCAHLTFFSPADVSPPPSPPSNKFTLGKPRLNQRKGAARLAVTVSGPGELALSGKGLKAGGAMARTVSAPGTVQLLIMAAGRKLEEAERDRQGHRHAEGDLHPDRRRPQRAVKTVKLGEALTPDFALSR